MSGRGSGQSSRGGAGGNPDLDLAGLLSRLAELGRKLGARSQRELARRLGVSHATLANLRRSGHFPFSSTIDRMADAAGVSRRWLATGQGPMVESAHEPVPQPSTTAVQAEPLALASIPLPPEALAQPWRRLLDLQALAWALAFAEQVLAMKGSDLAAPKVRLRLALWTLEEQRRAIGRPFPADWSAGLDLDTLARMLGIVEQFHAPRPGRADALWRLRAALMNYDLALYDTVPGAEPSTGDAEDGWELLPPEPEEPG